MTLARARWTRSERPLQKKLQVSNKVVHTRMYTDPIPGFISVQAIRLKKYGEAKEAKGEKL
jgi:hypothetical protein